MSLKQARLTEESFGSTDGKRVVLYTLENAQGMRAHITNYGGSLVSLEVPDSNGILDDVVLGYDSLDAYLQSRGFLGALIGRYGNRIRKGRFTLNNIEYRLTVNNGENHLHGGSKGFDKVVWDAKPLNATDPSLELSYLSYDGEEGYPGNLQVRVVCSLKSNNELQLDYFATTDKDTIVNLTNHSYFNLNGYRSGDILSHQLLIDAAHFTPVDAGLIPTGELSPVAGTPFDFSELRRIGERIHEQNDQLQFGKGYDHNWVLNGEAGQLRRAAKLIAPVSGRILEIWTTEPGLQFYSGNYLTDLKGKGGAVYNAHQGLCLETQHFPDSPNNPNFPSTVLKRGEQYRSTTIYRFPLPCSIGFSL